MLLFPRDDVRRIAAYQSRSYGPETGPSGRPRAKKAAKIVGLKGKKEYRTIKKWAVEGSQ